MIVWLFDFFFVVLAVWETWACKSCSITRDFHQHMIGCGDSMTTVVSLVGVKFNVTHSTFLFTACGVCISNSIIISLSNWEVVCGTT